MSRLIDADALIGELHTQFFYDGRDRTRVYAKVQDQPTIEPQWKTQWIPCSERLPERGKDVLVTRDYDGREDNNKSCRYVEVASCYGEDDDITWSSFSDEYKMKPRNHHVVAWMPLPEPYREDKPCSTC